MDEAMTEPDAAGFPISYMVLAKGTPVFDSEGVEVGKVQKVLAVDAKDVFDGVMIGTGTAKTRFIDADFIGRIYERRLELKITAEQVEGQPSHEGGAGAYDADFKKKGVEWRSEQ